jgi:5-methyltetrahydrofolate--homocysteine methyltransferase
MRFPRQRGKKLLSLPDYFRDDTVDIVPLQLVTIGHRASRVCEELNRAGEYTKSYFLHGLSVEAAEALARAMHERIREELQLRPDQGKRYSHGYPPCPDLAYNRVYLDLLQGTGHLDVTLTEACQFVPEQTTAALIVHHPQAEYFTI